MNTSSIAIVGMAGRFPGARSTAEFWQNLRNSVESIRDLSEAELLAAGASPEDLANPDYVRRAAVLDGVALFDAAFFGFSPRDASIMDPQHRHFLECAWEALEDAGHPPQRFAGSVGVFAGSGLNAYLIHNLLANRRLLDSVGLFQLKQTGNDKDVLATRVSYQLDLRGPSINVQTACSTSLVAVHLACQSLLNFECDMALAGGVSIEIPHGLGYIYREADILSRDGFCRPFDAEASGTVFSSGLGIVVLRRLEDALADRDRIRAVILGSAINNDGARKVGFLAPSIEGQAEVVTEALDYAGVPAASISYVETHGTATVVGDPIEVRALTTAFQNSTGHTAIGSLKSNIGHLDAAAGVASLAKTVLALEHAQIPASLHFEKINPHIELEGSLFYVNTKLADWPSAGEPRRAGVTSLGVGGTNVHVVLEEAPRPALSRQPKPYQVLIVSAKTASAADQAFTNLASHLAAHPEVNITDAAFTCQLGRAAFSHRRAIVVDDTPEALTGIGTKKPIAGAAARTAPVFLFSGQGSQYVNMGRELYEHEPVFRDTLDLCARHLREPLGIDLIAALYPPEAEMDSCAERLNQTWLTQPALFAIEYALAQWWISLGIEPAAMAGHSIGEYVAACLAGVFPLEEALAIVAARGRLIYDLPAGSMLAVPLAATDIHVNGTISLAAINNPEMCVVSGPAPDIAAYEESLKEQSIACRRLFTSHAFHSAMMEPILGEFEERLRGVSFNPPRIPYLSNVTGTWIKPEEAVDPAYWARHIRSTVRFSDNLAELLRAPERVLIEAGPGNVLTTLARQQGGPSAKAFPSLPHPRESIPALRCALQTLGRLWTLGVNVDWAKLHAPGSVQRVPLPTYPFERQKFWIEPDKAQPAPATTSTSVSKPAPSPIADDGISLYRRIWKHVIAVPQPLQKLDGSAAAPAPHKPAAAPSSAAGGESIESTLAVWWQDLLGVDEVGPDDDFFSLGGHSLIGVRLMAKIKKTFRVDLGLAILFEARTLSQLAQVIREASAPADREQRAWSALVPIHPNGSRTPLFCVHAVGGDVLFYEQLAKALGPDQPFYAFQSPLVVEPDRRDITIEEMASLYIKEMRAFLPQGPYLLGGASYGGFVLYEMARQLHEQGVVPGAVVMFDMAVPGSGEFFGRSVKMAKFLKNIRQGGTRYLWQKTREKSEYFWTKFMNGTVLPAGVFCYRLMGRSLSASLRFFWISEGHERALAGYTFKPFPGKITVVRALKRYHERLGRRVDPTLGWGGLARGGVEVVEVPTGHMGMLFEPYVETFAEKLKAILPL